AGEVVDRDGVGAAAGVQVDVLSGADIEAERYRARAGEFASGALLDHLVGEQLHRVWNGNSERLRSLEIDDQLELGRLKHRQVARFFAFQKPARNSRPGGDSLRRLSSRS